MINQSRQFEDHDAVVYHFCNTDLHDQPYTVDRNISRDYETMTSRIHVESKTWEITTYHDEHGFVISQSIALL